MNKFVKGVQQKRGKEVCFFVNMGSIVFLKLILTFCTFISSKKEHNYRL